jgi:hypothetical protein
MSMMFGMCGVTPDQARTLRANPALANDLAAVARQDARESGLRLLLDQLPPEERLEAATYLKAMRSSTQLQEFHKELDRSRPILSAMGTLEPALYLEKSWHILHYALTGDVVPVGSAGDALLSGEALGEDMGYGPPRLLSPESTREFSELLKRENLEDLQARLNYSAMMAAGVYGLPWGGGGSTSEFESEIRTELATYFPQLKNYVVQTAEKQNGLLMWLT